jgi:hypothetical protein
MVCWDRSNLLGLLLGGVLGRLASLGLLIGGVLGTIFRNEAVFWRCVGLARG